VEVNLCGIFFIVCLYLYFVKSNYQKRMCGITLTGLIPAHCCVCPKTGSRFPFANVIISFVFHDVRLEGICHFVIIGGIAGHHRFNYKFFS